jgi:hypothetical protein
MRCQTRSWRHSAAAAGILAVAAVAGALPGPSEDPFVFFNRLVTLDQADLTRVAEDDVAVRVLPGRDGHLGVFTAVRLDAPDEALVEWVREIEAFKRGPFVTAIRRFSEPPVAEDLEGLTLDAADVESIRRCRPGSCGLKLAAHEIDSLRQAAQRGGKSDGAVQAEFRRVVLDRVLAYRSGGLEALPPLADRRHQPAAADALAAVLGESAYLTDPLPGVAARLRGQPAGADADVESFMYWSKEQYGPGKPVIAVTQVDIVRPGAPPAPSVLVLSREVLATHYRTASLGVTAIVRSAGSSDCYLVYVNQSQVDVLDGLFGGLKRQLIESRLAGDSARVMRLVRARLESVPPGATGS